MCEFFVEESIQHFSQFQFAPIPDSFPLAVRRNKPHLYTQQVLNGQILPFPCNFRVNIAQCQQIVMDTVNVRIRELRLEHGFTQQYVADLLGIDRSNYSKYERGLLSVSADMLVALAKLYDVTSDYLLGLDG